MLCVVCVYVSAYECGYVYTYVVCTWHSVSAVTQSSGMWLDGPVGIGIAWNRLSSLVLLGCTALMRANSQKHPSGCLQFAQMGERMELERRKTGCM